MFGRYIAVIFLASIVHAATAKPSPRGIDFASNPLGRRSLTTGRITCVEPSPSGGSTHYLSSALTESGSIKSTNGEDFLVAEIDLDAATTGSVDIKFQPQRPWYQRLFSSETRYLAAAPPGEYCRHMGPSMETHAWLQGAERTTTLVPNRSLLPGQCILASSGGTSYAPTKLWGFDPSTQRLIPRWVNPDASTPDMHVFYKNRRGGIAFGITGNVSALDSWHNARECVLMFNPL